MVLLLSRAIQGSALDGYLSMFEESGRDLSEEQCFKMQVQTNVPRAARK